MHLFGHNKGKTKRKVKKMYDYDETMEYACEKNKDNNEVLYDLTWYDNYGEMAGVKSSELLTRLAMEHSLEDDKLGVITILDIRRVYPTWRNE